MCNIDGKVCNHNQHKRAEIIQCIWLAREMNIICVINRHTKENGRKKIYDQNKEHFDSHFPNRKL